MKEKEREFKGQFKDDYSQVLPIFIYPSEEQSQSLYPDMDKVIEKCSEVIERHSIYKKKKEYIKWIDDSYFLIGKARLYKEEFGLAEQTFEYVYVRYKKDPERYRGLNWLIKTFIETEQWDKAEEFIDLALDQQRKYPEEYIGHFHAIYADYHIKRDKDYEKAIEELELAVLKTKKKAIRRRYVYILAQLYQQKKNLLLATERYSKVLKLNPDYVMRFNAKISRAIAYDVSSTGGSEDIKKELNKMLKDRKNEEFRDQIYFALAELAIKEKDEPLAIEHLKNSTKYSVSNKKQKGLSYLRLADLYFEQPHYINAQAHYDSTLQFLPKEHPSYYDAEEKNENLQELVKNLKIIEEQDSLLRLSNLSDKEKKEKVKEIIKDLKDKEEQARLAELRKLEQLQLENGANLINVTQGGNRKGKWYFYNPTNISKGRNEFKQRWESRPLEDNWRRKNKTNANRIVAQNNKADENPDSTQTTKSPKEAKQEKYDPEFYLKNIPKDIGEQLIAHGKIAQALFNVGSIFKENFTDYNNAISSFERVTKDYDTSKYNLPSHYQLYRIYVLNDYTEKAEEEKQWVLDNHPFSEYAYLIKNPNYNKESKETKEKVEEFYAATYKLFKYGLYQDVIESCEKADKSFSTNHIKAKFDFLKAKSIGYLRPRAEFKTELEAIVKNHPEDEVKEQAQDILNFMAQQQQGKGATVKKAAVKKVTYLYNEKDRHIFILSAVKEPKSSKFQLLKNKLSDFNRQYFRESNLSITQSVLDDKNLYLIRTFDDQQKALRYIKALRNNTQIMLLIDQANGSEYIISTENFRLLFQSKNEVEYLKFFNTEYPV